MILAIVGSRGFTNYDLLKTELDKIENITEIVSGGAIGADKLAEKYAKEKNLKTTIILPEWNKHGKAAGPIRNQQIILKSTQVIAFWDGKSPGTKTSIDFAKKYKKPINIIKY